jgi:hypothetical protein
MEHVSVRERAKSMLKEPFLRGEGGFVLEKSELSRLRLKALRRGAWFRVLSRVDRAVVDLTLRVVEEVRSFRLARAVEAIVKKLEEAVEGRVSRLLKEVGFQVALKLSLLAQKWGNVRAIGWASDVSFAKFLVIMHINNPNMLRP